MKKDIKFMVIFSVTVLIFSSFTPFAYAKITPSTEKKETKGKGTLELLRTVQKAGATCEDDVWIDSLDWNEYQALLNKSIKMIDGFGNKELGELEENYESVGAGTNTDVIGAKNYFVPGVNGRPAILYDVMKKKVVNPDDTCHLNNLFSSGRVSYSTRLLGQMRYCAMNDTSCEGGEITAKKRDEVKKALQLLKDLKDTQEANWNDINVIDDARETLNVLMSSDEDVRNALERAGIDVEQIESSEDFGKALKKALPAAIGNLERKLTSSTPTSFAETDAAELMINADFLDLLSQTRVDFLEFIKSTRWLTDYTMIANVLSFASAGAAAATAAGMALKSKGGIKAILGKVLKARSGGVETIGEGLDLGTDAWRASDKVGDTANGIRGLIKNVKNKDDVIAIKTAAGELSGELKALRSQYEVLDISTFTPAQQLDYLENLAKIDNSIDALKTLGKLEEVGDLAKLDDVLTTAESASRSISATKPQLKAPFKANWGRIKEGASTLRRGTWAERGTVIANTLKYLFGNAFGGASGRLLSAFQTLNFWTAAGIWYNNMIWRQPQYSLSAASFTINNELKNLAHEMEQEHYLEIDKTAKLPSFQTYVIGVHDNIFNILGYRPDDSPIRSKLRNIQDIVFIYDQDAYALSNEKATNLIVSPFESTTGRGYWSFFSRFPDYSLVYNFEHPSGYLYSKKSALFMRLYNINIGGVLAEADDQFNKALLDGLTSWGRIGRDIIGVLTMVSIIPAVSHAVAGAFGAAGGGVIGLGVGILAGKEVALGPLYDITKGGYGQIVDIREVYKNKKVYCGEVFNDDEKAWILAGKGAIAALTTASIFLNWAKATPLVIVSFGVDVANMLVMYYESEFEQRIAEKLSECVDTSYSAIAYKEFAEQKEIKDLYMKVFQPIKAEAFNLLSSISPEIAGELDTLAESMAQQVLNINGELAANLVSTTGKEIYYVWFKDADIKWFQSSDCNIDLCEYQTGPTPGYRCMTQNGYFLLDEDGNPILDGIPQALSLRMNMFEDYMSVVQNVIEIVKKDSPFMEIYPTSVKILSDCGKNNIAGLIGVNDLDTSAQEQRISETLGKLEGIYTPEGHIWFDGTDVAVQFLGEVICENGETYGSREIFRFPNAHLIFYRDNQGKVEIINNNGIQCSLNLGADGAISFDNALIRSGINQPELNSRKAVDYTNVYHLFIYSLLNFDRSEFESLTIEDLCKDDGNFAGVKLLGGLTTADDPQLKALLDEICFTDIRGQNNESIIFRDGQVCITDINGQEQCFTIQGYNSDTNKVDLGGGYELGVDIGPDGVPEWWLYKDGQKTGNPIPMLWATGLGGAMMYNPKTGTISIKNEFPFAINPNFGIYGGGGLGMITPSLPPWGGTPTYPGKAGPPKPTPNILAQLPWAPSGFELIIFIIILFSGLLLIRVKYGKIEYKKKRDTP